MYRAVKRFLNTFKKRSDEDKRLFSSLTIIIGSKPINLGLYKLASQHASIAKKNKRGVKESNERLEYLGDAILGAVVADYLFKKYPFKDEGFLTEIRSRIVNRESLNSVGKKLGLNQFVKHDRQQGNLSYKSLYGDTLEALIGAVYLDKGFTFCQKFIVKKLMIPYFDLASIIDSVKNFKSALIEWSQKENKTLSFDIISTKTTGNHKEFIAEVTIDKKSEGRGFGSSKKRAEQDAAKKTLIQLGIIEEE